MSSKERILSAIRANQPSLRELPEISGAFLNSGISGKEPLAAKYIQSLKTIGGHSKTVNTYSEIIETLRYQFPDSKRMVSTFKELGEIAEVYSQGDIIATPENIDVAILGAHFGVAENGAVWVTEDIVCDRALPFICQHLVVIINAEDIVGNMHDAYARIGDKDYGFSIFIAGPSKTADIEQSLVLGAHGPISMTVLIIE